MMNATNGKNTNALDGWMFQLRPFQRWCNPPATMVPFLLFVAIECLLLFCLISVPSLFYLYLPALALVAWAHWKSFKAKAYEPHKSSERIALTFEGSTMLYGVKGRELKVPLPIKIGSGVLGCKTVILGPGYGLPIPENIADDPSFVEAASQDAALEKG